jgi:thioredoxin 1
VNEIAEETGLEVEVVDIDANPDMAESYDVLSIPTLLVVEDAKELARHTGVAPKSKILANLGL